MLARRRSLTIISWLLIIAFVLTACSQQTPTANTPTDAPVQVVSNDETLVAEITFIVTIPETLTKDQKLVIEVLDEVTGLALNVQRTQMERKDDTHYSVKIPIQAGSVVKYRYARESSSRAIEHARDGRQVRYRMYYALNPGVVEDVVSSWTNQAFTGGYGRIQGHVLQKDTNSPLPGSLVAAGGQQTITASDGSFLLDGLPPGKHNLVVYSLDGSTPPFQQEAIVAADSNTPAEVRLEPTHYVNITFDVKTPDNIPDGIPLRLVGNIYPLGNTFADLRGGINTIASRAPTLTFRQNHAYSITMRLPTGLDLRYKYTLGDGFWNSERRDVGRFTARQLIVPDHDLTLTETIQDFRTAGIGAITFNVTVPAGMAADENLSIQFNPYGWTEPIPMWPMGGNRWVYVLYSPLDHDIVTEAGYRFCKNDQCGIADDSTTQGSDVAGKLFKPTADPQLIAYEIKQWAWRVESSTAVTVTSDPIQVKPADFMTGVELLPDYHPSWQAYMGSAIENIKAMHAGWIILSPTWHYTSDTPPVLSGVPGEDASWYDLSRMAILAHEKGMEIAIHPTTSYYQPAELWWQQSARDANWWQSWFDRYETFILNYADFSEQSGAKVLILGDSSVAPALPDGKLFDGTPSGVPGDAADRWTALIAKVRLHFTGKVMWRIDYPADFGSVPDFLSNVDGIYVVLNGKLGDFQEPTKSDIRQAVQTLLENDVRALRDRFDKPLTLGIAYPSASGAANGCVVSADACLPGYVFQQAGLDLPSATQNLSEQAEIYNAIFEALNVNDWIAGVVASGYYPAVAIEDKSNSIRGKPAADVIWFWFDHFLPGSSTSQ